MILYSSLNRFVWTYILCAALIRNYKIGKHCNSLNTEQEYILFTIYMIYYIYTVYMLERCRPQKTNNIDLRKIITKSFPNLPN